MSLFRCCRNPPYVANYQDSALKNVHDDLLLFKGVPANSADQFDVAQDQQGISLVRITRWQRFVNWITGSNSNRLARLAAYTQRACQIVPPDMDPVQIVQFYKNLRRFVPLAANSEVMRNIGQILEGQVYRTEQIYRNTVDELNYLGPLWASDERLHNKKSEVAHKRWDMLYAETHFADCVGNGFTPAGAGVNGALFGHGRDGRNTMVRKDNEKDERIFNERTSTLGILRSQEQVCKNDPRQAEVVAFEASDFFDFDVVPPTNTDLQGHSYQVFEPGGIDANDARLKELDPERFDEDEIEKLQTMALFDYLIGDLDGHDKNWKVIFDEDDRIEKVVKFDNGNSFPEEPLGRYRDYMTLNKTYAWKNHGWAQRPLRPRPGSRLEKILNKLRDSPQQVQFWMKINDKYPGFGTTNRIQLMRERIAVIHAVSERNMSMALVGQIYNLETLNNMATLNGALVQASVNDYYYGDGDPLHNREPARQPQQPPPAAAPLNAPPPPLLAHLPIGRLAEHLENDEKQVVPALRGPDPTPPKPSVVQQAWNGAKWMATPVTTPVGWAWSGVTNLASKLVPTLIP